MSVARETANVGKACHRLHGPLFMYLFVENLPRTVFEIGESVAARLQIAGPEATGTLAAEFAIVGNLLMGCCSFVGSNQLFSREKLRLKLFYVRCCSSS